MVGEAPPLLYVERASSRSTFGRTFQLAEAFRPVWPRQVQQYPNRLWFAPRRGLQRSSPESLLRKAAECVARYSGGADFDRSAGSSSAEETIPSPDRKPFKTTPAAV